MKRPAAIAGAVALLFAGSANAILVPVDLSPPAGLALNPANYALGDHAVGLAALNAVGQPASPATGDEIGGGIVFDNVTKALSFSFGYGSDFGFVDLAGTYSAGHIHGPAAVQFPNPNIGGGVAVSLTGNHLPGSSANTGSFAGSVVLTAGQEADLLNNLLYINVHSSAAPGGEIRGQLIPVIPEPATLALAALGLGLVTLRRYRGV